nr:MAG TPA: hypothetical protein [Caudoviricetes sp.]
MEVVKHIVKVFFIFALIFFHNMIVYIRKEVN